MSVCVKWSDKRPEVKIMKQTLMTDAKGDLVVGVSEAIIIAITESETDCEGK